MMSYMGRMAIVIKMTDLQLRQDGYDSMCFIVTWERMLTIVQDPVTGLGTPDYGKLLDIFLNLP